MAGVCWGGGLGRPACTLVDPLAAWRRAGLRAVGALLLAAAAVRVAGAVGAGVLGEWGFVGLVTGGAIAVRDVLEMISYVPMWCRSTRTHWGVSDVAKTGESAGVRRPEPEAGSCVRRGLLLELSSSPWHWHWHWHCAERGTS